jgi:hypothetical protein
VPRDSSAEKLVLDSTYEVPQATSVLGPPGHLGVPGGELTAAEVAQQTGRSIAWVKRHAKTLGGKIVNGAYLFPQATIERRVSTVEKITLGGRPGRRPADWEPNVGQRAAAIYERLEQSQSVSQIVRELSEPPEFVAKMRAQWLAGYEMDRQGLRFTCGCGAPSNPHTARCDRCASKTMVVTEAQRALLDGQPLPPPETCACSGCGNRKMVSSTDHLCAACRDRIEVVAEGGCLKVILRSTSGPLVLRALSVKESRALSGALSGALTSPLVEGVATEAAVPVAALGAVPLPPEVEAARQDIAEHNRIKAELEEVKRRSSERALEERKRLEAGLEALAD